MEILQPSNTIAAIEPLACRLPLATQLTGFSRSELYRRAALPDGTPGKILLLKCGNSTLVDVASLKAAVAGLPRASIRVRRIA